MCQTTMISRHIGRIGRRSFDRRMRIASPLYVEKKGEVARLLNEVDRFSAGLAPIIIGLFFFNAIQLVFIGFLAEYVMSINTRVMNRPLVIEEERIIFI